jgi:hypothetical protein
MKGGPSFNSHSSVSGVAGWIGALARTSDRHSMVRDCPPRAKISRLSGHHFLRAILLRGAAGAAPKSTNLAELPIALESPSNVPIPRSSRD